MWIAIALILLVLAFATLPNFGHMQRFDLGWFPPVAFGALALALAILLLAGQL